MPVLGCQSHVGHLAGHLLEMQLDVPAGAILKKAMEGMGIQVHLKKLTSEVKGSDRVEGLAFKDYTSLDCDMVIVAAGTGRTRRLAYAPVSRSNGQSWSTITCAPSTTLTFMSSANVRSIAVASTAWLHHSGIKEKSLLTTSRRKTPLRF